MLMVAIGLNVLANAPISLSAIGLEFRRPAVIHSECYSDRVNAEFRTRNRTHSLLALEFRL
ncbi:MAG: hypothetical protein DMC59_05455 [Verrucomicrobia bacterium]|nr:MAG: hypothetical protein DMC59_05455 [Verrucomicrobiota bacterium]